ncbi:preprotein translocase subunit SecE [Allokutzneria sp. NRRL B-24872]|uniref:preprotein translocase subunit SecE n=1 Tax=Allokutzneria sp. NRRL B-24872 TaxID=1137961 RepID=UPI000A3BB2F1|nr:preprotein translocase subunit SecE [Allokutzneria sp. NRRL B-24872]
MSERSEQERSEGSDDTSRPVTAAARRERRGSARPASRRAAKRSEGASASGDVKGKPTPSRDRQEQQKKGNPFKRFGRFLREVVAELRKVIWPTRKQLVTYTAVVLVFVAFMVGLVAGLDVAFAQGVLWLFG